MNDYEHETRERRYRKKKSRFGRFFFLLIVLAVAIGAYGVTQYKSGLELASETKLPEETFIGDEPSNVYTNYLIIGVDTRGEEQSRSDTMMLLSWNRETNELKLVSFMRDIYADIPEYQSYKLNTAYYLGGAQLLKDTLTSMFDVPIHHYALIDFHSFESLIDILAPNGVEMDVEKDMSAYIGVSLSKGVQSLNGKELLGYARFRHDEEGDFGRVKRQQKVIDTLKNELLAPSNLKNLPKLMGAARGYVTTDIEASEEIKTVFSILAGGGVEIDKMTIPVEGTYQFTSYDHAGAVIEINQEANTQHLHEFLQMTGE